MLDSLKPLLDSDLINEETRSEITEAWEAKLNEAREQVRAELREEFAQRYEHDKSVMVEALDKMVTEGLAAEIQAVFAEKQAVINDVLSRTTAGGVTVNGTIMHLTSPHLPFGGVGESGMGGYHGISGVRLFQHMKPVLSRGTKLDPSIAYPPYTARKAKIFRKIL